MTEVDKTAAEDSRDEWFVYPKSRLTGCNATYDIQRLSFMYKVSY